MNQLELVTKIAEDIKINNEIIHFTVKQLCEYYKITYSQFYYYKEVYPLFSEANKIRVDKRIPRKKKADKNQPKVVNDYFSIKQHRNIAKK